MLGVLEVLKIEVLDWINTDFPNLRYLSGSTTSVKLLSEMFKKLSLPNGGKSKGKSTIHGVVGHVGSNSPDQTSRKTTTNTNMQLKENLDARRAGRRRPKRCLAMFQWAGTIVRECTVVD